MGSTMGKSNPNLKVSRVWRNKWPSSLVGEVLSSMEDGI